MTRKRYLLLAVILLVATPMLACNPTVLEAWGDLVATARAVWASIWDLPEPDYEAVGILSTQELLAAYGEPPVLWVDSIALTIQQIAAAWGLGPPYSTAFTLGDPFPKPDGSGHIMAPLQFPNPGGAYGVPLGAPITGICLEFEEVDDDGTPVLLLAPEFQIGDWVLPTTTPQIGYSECPSGITPTPTPTPTPLPTETPTPTPIPLGDSWEDDDPPNSSAISVGESQARSLDPFGDVDEVHLWGWAGLHLEVLATDLGGLVSTAMEVVTCDGVWTDLDGGESRVEWSSQCNEVAVIRVFSENEAYGPSETYSLQVNPRP